MKKCLSTAILIGVFAGFLFRQGSFAQLVIEKPLQIRQVQGYVTDETGKAVAGAKVELLRDGKPVLKTNADQTGWFRIDGASGRYVLGAWAGATEAGREVAVETNLLTLFCHKTLYIIVRTEGSCMDCSIRVYTSKRQYFNAIWRNTGHYY
jgi:hypothetical protein